MAKASFDFSNSTIMLWIPCFPSTLLESQHLETPASSSVTLGMQTTSMGREKKNQGKNDELQSDH